MASTGAQAPPPVARAGAALLVVGAAGTLASLWRPWVVPDSDLVPGDDGAPVSNGWEWMTVGDVLLVALCGAAVLLAVLTARGRSATPRRIARGAATIATLFVMAAAAVLVLRAIAPLNFQMDPDDAPGYRPLGGFGWALAGLAAGAVGAVMSTRASAKRAIGGLGPW
ncbi:MAG: hypothetical protein HZB46_01425 [Solirubrobacterales bacterium]|nr:hypothetical protein [Solirubrobacterales bacterium]